MPDLSGQVAFITGAAHGQGRAVALTLAGQGVYIVAFDIAPNLSAYSPGSSDDLDSLQREVEALDAWCLTVTGDVRSDADVTYAVERALGNFGRIDILFTNASICTYGLSYELSEDEWDTMLDINLKGAWLVARRIIPIMIQQGSGIIINNSSIAGLRGMNRLSHYTASKWGLVGLTKSWAIELAPYNIRVNSIHPIGVNTPMNDGLADREGTATQEIAERSAIGLLPIPWVEADDVAGMVLYLVSDSARFVTGSQFVLDAGLLNH